MKKSIVTTKSGKTFTARRAVNHIPDELLQDPILKEAINKLPANYNFEIYKTIWKIKSNNIKKVALQFPEGLLMFANPIADIIEDFTDSEVMILGDVTYGACCVDDFTAKKLGAELLIHYGHSCLIPITQTQGIQMLYIFVDIKIDSLHFVETLKFNFQSNDNINNNINNIIYNNNIYNNNINYNNNNNNNDDDNIDNGDVKLNNSERNDVIKKIALVSTVQFITTLQVVSKELSSHFDILLPQSKPLSPGEILGCTSPRLPNDVDAIVYLGDGRFHIESIIIHNPGVPAFKYDPYSKTFTREKYDFEMLHKNRKQEIDRAKDSKCVAVVMGTLGRQGSPRVVETLKAKLRSRDKDVVVILMTELFPDKLKLFEDIDAWVQVACPRLSIDWGTEFHKPLLNPYEANVMMKSLEYQQTYPMDYYANNSLADYAVNYKALHHLL
ncbi:hypothetical protein HELRODRAFT_113590 [Helobdella robusta]|uniref:2-(3-amino-3-carboxypropyl)histidine synthase subunit 1 n=1 Tax=Helobdella robusta TaxID=6412 RepID=T1EFU1_HELRO|nr:hypothetical protein HELRODRAFT_113590 [Helobdella robusta]ESN99832.1 hypothetical protein HELRODRAFT_113590 [Helobdella robusta]